MHDSHEPPRTQTRRARWVLIAFLGIAGFFLIAEHRVHVLGALPYLLLIACPLLHLFMHHGHGHHDHGDRGVRESGRKADEP